MVLALLDTEETAVLGGEVSFSGYGHGWRFATPPCQLLSFRSESIQTQVSVGSARKCISARMLSTISKNPQKNAPHVKTCQMFFTRDFTMKS